MKRVICLVTVPLINRYKSPVGMVDPSQSNTPHLKPTFKFILDFRFALCALIFATGRLRWHRTRYEVLISFFSGVGVPIGCRIHILERPSTPSVVWKSKYTWKEVLLDELSTRISSTISVNVLSLSVFVVCACLYRVDIWGWMKCKRKDNGFIENTPISGF